MVSADLDVRRLEISAIVNDIATITRDLRAKGIDARDPGDREAYDIISRIERRLAASQPIDQHHEAAE